MKELPASQAYRLLEPGPIVMVSTRDNGRANVMTMGFHMMIQHDPPLIGCVIGPWDQSYQVLRKTGECVIAVPGPDRPKPLSTSETVPARMSTSSKGLA